MDAERRIEDMHDYYARRMGYYDEGATSIADGWVTQELVDWITTALAGRDVLEIACGTGLWTAWIAPVATSILATDYTEVALDAARRKTFPANVRFQRENAYALTNVSGTFTGGFNSDWWSHVPKSKRQDFLRTFHGKLQPGATVLMGDHLNGPKSEEYRDEEGNHIQRRSLKDGTHHDVIKNFPTQEELRADILPYATETEYRTFPNCGPKKTGRWCVKYVRK